MNVPPPPPRSRQAWYFWIAVFALLAITQRGADIRPLDLFTNAEGMQTIASGFFPPDFADWRMYADELLITVQIALWGTALAIFAAVPLALLAAANISPAWIRFPIRRFLDAARAINEMVFALLFVAAVGLGPFAGVLALAVHTAGTLGKLFAEAVESIDPRPVEGVRATGARRLEVIGFGVIPQVLPLWTSYALYRLESNVRSASVVGMVGAGGIGVILWDVLRSFEYGKTCAVLILLVTLVSLIDLVSGALRKRIIG